MNARTDGPTEPTFGPLARAPLPISVGLMDSTKVGAGRSAVVKVGTPSGIRIGAQAPVIDALRHLIANVLSSSPRLV
jgi:hypothetical protein